METTEIIGGGLSGLSAALALAAKGVQVRLFERKAYPCVKLCGEFLSPEGFSALKRITGLSADELKQDLGLSEVRDFAWISRAGTRVELGLEPLGWGVRRDRLDHWLALRASSRGVDVRLGTQGIIRQGTPQIHATGKEQPGAAGRYFAVKGYAADRSDGILEGRDIVLCQLVGGYIGFTRMSDGSLSYSALFDRQRVSKGWRFSDWASLVDGPFRSNGHLAAVASRAEPLLKSHVGAARFDFETRAAVVDGHWRIGDAVQLVPPFVGDGMSMALESGELAALGWREGWSARRYQAEWNKKFAGRVRVARALHPLLWLERGHEPVLSMLARMPRVLRWIYTRTRGQAA